MRFVTYKEYAEEFNYPEMLDDVYDPCGDCCLDFNGEDCNMFDCEGGLFVKDAIYLPEDEDYVEEPLVAAMEEPADGYPYCKDTCVPYQRRGHCGGCNNYEGYEPVALKQLKGAYGENPCKELPEEWGMSMKERQDALSTQVGGNHYKDMAIQPTEYCQKNKLNTCESNIIKYASRHMNKGGIEDVKKIIHYARLLAKLDYGVEL